MKQLLIKTTSKHGSVTEEIPVNLLNEALDHLYELRGEWDWKKDEVRAGNKAEYDILCGHIEAMEKLLGRKPSKNLSRQDNTTLGLT